MATVLLGDVLSHGVCCEEWRSSRVFKSNLYLMVMCSRLFLLINQGSVAIVKYRSDFTLWPVLHYEQVRLLVLLPRTVFTVHSEYRKKISPLLTVSLSAESSHSQVMCLFQSWKRCFLYSENYYATLSPVILTVCISDKRVQSHSQVY